MILEIGKFLVLRNVMPKKNRIGFKIHLFIAGGIMANSLAIATDAAHLLTDFASFLISLFSIWMASKPASVRMNFGWHRAEVIGATVSVLLIWVVTGILVYMAVQRIISKEYEVDATIMLITSGIGKDSSKKEKSQKFMTMYYLALVKIHILLILKKPN